MAFRPAPRTTLALRIPDVYRGTGIARSHHATAIHGTFSCLVQHGVYGGCVSPNVLGDTHGNPEPVCGGSVSGNDQRSWQHCGFCRTVFIRLPAHSNREFFVRPGRDDVVSNWRRAADPVYAQTNERRELKNRACSLFFWKRYEFIAQAADSDHVARIGRLVLDVPAQTHDEIVDGA